MYGHGICTIAKQRQEVLAGAQRGHRQAVLVGNEKTQNRMRNRRMGVGSVALMRVKFGKTLHPPSQAML